MGHDPYTTKRWPQLAGVLDPHGLVASFQPAEDESVDDCIDVKLDDGSGQELGDIQISSGYCCANAWTDATHEEMAHGPLRRSVVAAAKDLVGLLEKHNRIAAR